MPLGLINHLGWHTEDVPERQLKNMDVVSMEIEV